MGGVISVEQVETADAAPLAAPHRISGDPAKDEATVTVAYDHDGESYVDGLMLSDGDDGTAFGQAWCVGLVISTGPTPSSGRTLLFVGGACSEQLTCTEARTCNAGDDAFAPGGTVEESILHAELADLGDGAVTIYAHAQVEAQGWV